MKNTKIQLFQIFVIANIVIGCNNKQDLKKPIQPIKKSNMTTTTNTNNQLINKENELNELLFGTWRYTEVISSGSGDFYASFSTDYFIEFNNHGNFISWTGNSAGGNSDISYENINNDNVNKGEWFTEGQFLFFVDPKTNEKASITFYAEKNRVIFSSQNSKRVYERIH